MDGPASEVSRRNAYLKSTPCKTQLVSQSLQFTFETVYLKPKE